MIALNFNYDYTVSELIHIFIKARSFYLRRKSVMEINVMPKYNQPLVDILYSHQLTYQQLAKLMNVAHNSVRNFMYGNNRPSFDFMMRLYVSLELTDAEMIAVFFDYQSSLPHMNSYKEFLMRKENKGD